MKKIIAFLACTCCILFSCEKNEPTKIEPKPDNNNDKEQPREQDQPRDGQRNGQPPGEDAISRVLLSVSGVQTAHQFETGPVIVRGKSVHSR